MFSSTFQGKFNFQGLFKTVLYIQVLFKPVRTLTRIAALMFVSKTNAKQPIWLYIKECAFICNTWKTCPLQINLKHWKCKSLIWDMGQLCHLTKFYQWKIPYFFKSRNLRRIKRVSCTLLVIEEWLSFWLAGLRYRSTFLTLICVYPFIWWLKNTAT